MDCPSGATVDGALVGTYTEEVMEVDEKYSASMSGVVSCLSVEASLGDSGMRVVDSSMTLTPDVQSSAEMSPLMRTAAAVVVEGEVTDEGRREVTAAGDAGGSCDAAATVAGLGSVVEGSGVDSGDGVVGDK